ncbi:MAG: GFA family protein [Xanthomonadales bacterium]|nr:GFA family protein [Xanthomonadales bacterium]
MATKTLSGSCLCGAVRYTTTGEAQRFYHCHCSRCRKASGTGHASNLFLKGTLTWESGEERVKCFKVPDAERFTNTFCETCGGRVPRFIEQYGVVFIPAGSLDDEPDLDPQARIFMGSRTAWSCGESHLPEFDEYPG